LLKANNELIGSAPLLNTKIKGVALLLTAKAAGKFNAGASPYLSPNVAVREREEGKGRERIPREYRENTERIPREYREKTERRGRRGRRGRKGRRERTGRRGRTGKTSKEISRRFKTTVSSPFLPFTNMFVPWTNKSDRIAFTTNNR
jgi:hypothetical protein